MHRRDFLRYAIGGGALAMSRLGRAEADMAAPMRPQLRVMAGVSAGAAKIGGAVLDTRTDGGHDFVTLGADLGAHATRIFSADNANARFHVWSMILPVPKDQWAYLVTDDGGVRMASSIGSDGGDGAAVHTATFEVEAAFARPLAMMQGLRATDRVALDGGVTATWSNPGGAVKGQPVQIQIRIANNGANPVRIAIGGRDDGPRNNRFVFTARRASDGHAVAIKEGLDLGGRMVRAPLAPGAHVDVSADLRAWIDAPGAYDLDCEYQGELTPDTDDAGRWPDHGAEIWDYVARASMRVAIV